MKILQINATYGSGSTGLIVKDIGDAITAAGHEAYFAYQSGNELVINASGSLQIFDVMGRMVYSNDVVSDNGRIDISIFNKAAYILRLINEDGVKTQKVVIY